jgi:hypothetical protein
MPTRKPKPTPAPPPVLAKVGDKLTCRSQHLDGLPSVIVTEVVKVRRYPRWQTLHFAVGHPIDQMLAFRPSFGDRSTPSLTQPSRPS